MTPSPRRWSGSRRSPALRLGATSAAAVLCLTYGGARPLAALASADTPGAPAPPPGFTAALLQPDMNTVRLTWGGSNSIAADPGATYRINRDGTWIRTVPGYVTAFNDVTATFGAAHTYYVVAGSPADGDSPSSALATVTTPQLADRGPVYTAGICQVDASAAPDLIDIAYNLVHTCATVYPEIVARLSDPGVPAPHRIVFDDSPPAAVTSAGVVHINIAWIRGGEFDPGLLPHELTHVVQAYPGGPSWLVEGIATYMSYKLGYSVGVAHCDAGDTYHSGYGCGASLLNYVERVADPHIVRETSDALRDGTYSDDLFVEKTGKSADTLYADCLQYECRTGGLIPQPNAAAAGTPTPAAVAIAAAPAAAGSSLGSWAVLPGIALLMALSWLVRRHSRRT